MTAHKGLAHILASGALDAADAAHVRALATRGEAPDQILSRLGLMDEAAIARQFADAAGLDAVIDGEGLQIDAGSFAARVNRAFLAAARCAPLTVDQDTVTALIADPFDADARAGLAFALDVPVRFKVAPAGLIDRLIARLPDAGVSDPGGFDRDIAADAERLRDMASAAPTVRLVSGLILDAAEARASDIHIEPGPREAVVRQRVDGVLRETGRIAASQALAAVSRIKVLCDLDIAEHRRPQDGALRFPVAGRTLDLRVSVIPTEHGESLAVRLLDPTAGLRDLEALGFAPAVTAALRTALARPNGLVLVTGPTGSGKTTTLYAALRHLSGGERKILTIEDPIEYRLSGVSQSQVNPAIGMDFARALRSFLRHDPDVIMVGEIRDAETARVAVQAAMTGHLVLSTLHTNDAPGAVVRLADMGVEPYLLAATLAGAFAQRLVRTVCADCAGVGCARCAGSGYAGRAAIAEGFVVDDAVRALVREGGGGETLRTHLNARGFISMAQDARAKAEAGLTTREEAARFAGAFDE
ncbi:MAG: GspE/PulE family protein [Oceanicaulis sp.]